MLCSTKNVIIVKVAYIYIYMHIVNFFCHGNKLKTVAKASHLNAFLEAVCYLISNFIVYLVTVWISIDRMIIHNQRYRLSWMPKLLIIYLNRWYQKQKHKYCISLRLIHDIGERLVYFNIFTPMLYKNINDRR